MIQLEIQRSEVEQRVSELEEEAELWENLKQEKANVVRERLEMQSEEQLGMKEVEQGLRTQLETQSEELERVRAVLNNYEWKLFCLETQLDLYSKEKKQLKFVVEKQEVQLGKVEAALKDQRITLFSEEEENRLLSS